MAKLIVVSVALLLGCSTSQGPRSVVLLKPDEGDYLWIAPQSPDKLGSGGELQIFVDAETHPGARASIAKFTMGVGSKLPVHRHDKTEEFAYILSGEGMVTVVDENGKESEVPISAGYVWYNPPGAWHGVRNSGDTKLSMIFATVPNKKKGLLSYFRKVCVGPGKKGITISAEELERLGAKHDLIFRRTQDSQ